MNYKKEYDGKLVFKPNMSKIRVGDILLTRNRRTESFKGRRVSDVIAAATGGHFSHALICGLPPTFIEAVGNGVSSLSLQNCFCHDLSDCRLLRYKDDEIAKSAGSWAISRLGQNYSVRRAILSVVPHAAVPTDDSGIFCSALVAVAYRSAGAAEFLHRDPMKVTPGTLHKISGLTDITADVFESILSPRNIEQMTALDGDRAISPAAEQAKLFASYHDLMRPKIKEILRGDTQLDWAEPQTFMECLNFLVRSLALDADKLSVETRGRILKLDKVAFELIANGALDEIVSKMTLLESTEAARLISESFKANPDIGLDDLMRVQEFTRTQIEERSQIFENPTLPAGVSLTWDKWLDVTARVVDALNARNVAVTEVIQRAFPASAFKL